MSFNSHRRAALDESLPLQHRASHARSCALHVANKLGVKRQVVINAVATAIFINLDNPTEGAEITKALAYLEALRHGETKLNA